VGSGTSHAEELTRDASSLDVVAVGESLLDEASAMRGATELAPGRYDVVFGPQAAAELVAFLPAFGFTAAALAAGVGVVAAGDRRFSALVTVVDDATGGPGLPFPFDCEGVSKQRVELIASGVPHGVVSDLASATVTGGSTGHAHIAREEAPAARAANLRLEAGSFGHGIDGLVAGVEQGVYIQRLWYTRVVDSARGVITGTTRDAAFLIRDGKLDRPVSGMRFTESVLDALERVDALGSDVHCLAIPNVWNGCVGAPAMRVRGFRLGVAARTASSR
jgi:predicted Zn-dependent protease